MEIKFFFSNIRPLLVNKDQEIISDCFKEEIKKSDQLNISVGFSSCDSLRELDRLIAQQNIKNVCLILGMYFFNGFSDSLLQLALEINKKWQKSGIGEIRVTHSLKYHGKLYCFLKDNQIFSVISGSPNLSFLEIKKQLYISQYEIATFTNDPSFLKDSLDHINRLKSKDVSENIAILNKQQLFSSENVQLRNQRMFKIDWN